MKHFTHKLGAGAAGAAALALALGLSPSQALAAEKIGVKDSYVDISQVEKVYGSAKDEISPDKAQAMLLDLVNAARAGGQLARLEPSAPAQKLAQEHSDDMAAQHYLNHYDLLGRKCELRFNALGETDNVSENIAMYVINAPVYLTPQLVQRLHNYWMQSPDHHSTIMDAAHTHLGCAFAFNHFKDETGTDVTCVATAEEFVDDYGSCERLPDSSKPGDVLHLSGALDTSRVRFAYIGLGSEDLPFERTPQYQMEHLSGYSTPDPGLAILAVEDGDSAKNVLRGKIPYTRQDAHSDSQTGAFSADVPIAPQWPHAAYYISVWVVTVDSSGKVSGTGKPFCAMTQVVLVQ